MSVPDLHSNSHHDKLAYARLMILDSRMTKAKFTSRTGSCLSGPAVSSSISALTLAQCNFLFLEYNYICISSSHNFNTESCFTRELFVQPPNLPAINSKVCTSILQRLMRIMSKKLGCSTVYSLV